MFLSKSVFGRGLKHPKLRDLREDDGWRASIIAIVLDRTARAVRLAQSTVTAMGPSTPQDHTRLNYKAFLRWNTRAGNVAELPCNTLASCLSRTQESSPAARS